MIRMAQSLERITRDIWSTAFGLEVVRTADGDAASLGECHILSSVELLDERDYVVLLRCPTLLARRVGGIMFDREATTLLTEELEDVMGELANMTGGNLKTLLPGCARQSLPIATMRHDESDRPALPKNDVVCTMSFACDGEPFIVTVVRRGSREPAEITWEE